MSTCEIHEEYSKRMAEEHDRMNKRLKEVEASVKEISKLTNSVERMAVTMEQMLKVQNEQSEQLKTLESQDGEKWRKVSTQVIMCIVTAVVGFVLAKIGF